jgi:plasmid maintenance system antidote protein VapI
MKNYTEGEILKVLRERFTPRQGETQTQTQIAAKLGISVPYIQAILAGSRPLTATVVGALGFRKLPARYVSALEHKHNRRKA